MVYLCFLLKANHQKNIKTVPVQTGTVGRLEANTITLTQTSNVQSLTPQYQLGPGQCTPQSIILPGNGTVSSVAQPIFINNQVAMLYCHLSVGFCVFSVKMYESLFYIMTVTLHCWIITNKHNYFIGLHCELPTEQLNFYHVAWETVSPWNILHNSFR